VPGIFEDNADFFSRIDYTTHKLPFYIVGVAFLALTLIVEIPIGYFGIRSSVKIKKRLMATIVAANTITTVAVAIIERTIYKGHG